MSLNKRFFLILITILVTSLVSFGCSLTNDNEASQINDTEQEINIVDETETLFVDDVQITIMEKSVSELGKDIEKVTGEIVDSKPTLGSWLIVKINRNNQKSLNEQFILLNEKFEVIAPTNQYLTNLDAGVLIFDVKPSTETATSYIKYEGDLNDGFIKIEK